VKLIAEPWDLGEGGYQVGNFPPLWSEWNGKYRDTARDFWRGTDRTLAEFAYRFTGSSDLYEGSARRPYASVNFITAHDGFTLRDLVSYNDKHNEANGEDNRDGESHNRSWNCGAEGPTDDPNVNALRAKQQRNFLTALMLSQGVPMLLGGDEMGRTQQGNNNAYCQDNEISWYDWENIDEGLLHFARRLIRLRHRHPVFRRRRWFHGRPIHGSGVSDIGWFTPGGTLMSDDDWSVGFAKSLGVFLNGQGIPTPDSRGERVVDDSFYVMFNAHHEPLDFRLPPKEWGQRWTEVLDTSKHVDLMSEEGVGRQYRARGTVKVQPLSLLLLRRIDGSPGSRRRGREG
jgi:glycogen operon protein